MKKILILAISGLFFISGCSLPMVNHTILKSENKALLENTISLIDYCYSYDYSVQLDIIAKKSTSVKITADKEDAVLKSFASYDNLTLVNFYENVYRIYTNTVWWQNYYRKNGDFANYNYLNSRIIPDLTEFTNLIEKTVVKRVPAYSADIAAQKVKIEKEVAFHNKSL